MNTIATLRKAKGWNQTLLAEAAGIEQSTVSKVENGWDGITLRKLKKIAAALGVNTYQLFIDDTSAAEAAIIQVYRSLPDSTKAEWRDMALLAKAGSQTEDQ